MRGADFLQATPAYVDKLPCAKHAWAEVTGLIDTARKSAHTAADGVFAELEVRFGRRDATFEPGVPESAFAAVEARLDTGRDWAKVVDWHNVHAFHYPSAIPGDARKVRTEIMYPPRDAAGDADAAVEHIHKKRVNTCDYRTVPIGAQTSRTADLRIALNTEHPVPEEDLPAEVTPSLVHIKQRKQYYYAPVASDAPVWCYNLTRRWVGDTFEAAALARKTRAPVCEIEIECVRPEYFDGREPGHVAVKLLCKAADILAILSPALQNHASYIIEPVSSSMLWNR